jgi:hypothetical protein
MTIWLLAILLLASLAGLGFRQGAVRVGFSLIGILIGVLLAPPLGKFVAPIFKAVGVKNPTLLWVLGPFVVFIIISAAFKIAAFAVHQKIEVYYKYKGGDLRNALFERLNRRVGLCLGLLNGTLYLIMIAWVIYAFSYWTIQLGSSEAEAKGIKDPLTIRMLNTMGTDLHKTGFAKVAKSVDRLKDSFYDAADVAGLLFNNSLLEARLSRYPGFLDLAERPEFQTLGADAKFGEMRLNREPLMNVLNHPSVQPIMDNPDLLKTIWTTAVPDLKDLTEFLQSAKSAKYDPEKLLGRWDCNINLTMAAYRKAKPNTPSNKMLETKKWMMAVFAKTTFLATPGHQAILKNMPPLKGGPGATGSQAMTGQWQGGEGKYQVTLSGNEELFANVEGDRLTMKISGFDLVFDRES